MLVSASAPYRPCQVANSILSMRARAKTDLRYQKKALIKGFAIDTEAVVMTLNLILL